jgi:nicotinamidase-related amidase
MSTTKKHPEFTPANAAIILVDHQPGVLAMVGSLPAKTVTANTALLAQLGEELEIPLVITSTRENLEFLGTNLAAIQKAAPKGYEKRIRRAGTLNAFHDPAFVEAVENLDRKNLVMAGLLTDVCLFHSVVSALEAGYNVQVVADACGTSSVLADTVTYDRLRDMGAVITSTYGILFELYSDLSTPEGQKAEGIAAASAQAQQKESAKKGALLENIVGN